MTTTVLAYFPSPPAGRLASGSASASGVCAVHHRRDRRRPDDRRSALGGAGRRARRHYDVALWAVPFGLIGGRLYHLMTDWRTYFGEGGAGIGAALRIWDGGLGIWGAVALGGVGAWIACRRRGYRCPLSAMRLRRESCSRRRSADSATISTRSSTAARRRCRGGWRSSTGAMRRVDVHSLDGVSTGQVRRSAAHVPLRVAVECPGFRRADLGGPPLQASATVDCSRCMSRRTASAGSGSSCCATTPRRTSRASGSTRSHRCSCSSARWCTSCWRRRDAKIRRRSVAQLPTDLYRTR